MPELSRFYNIFNGIAYSDNSKPIITVNSVRPLDGYKLWLRFSTGEEKVFDVSPLLDTPCFKVLKDKDLFNKVYVDYGVAVWLDGKIDIAPETLYQESKKI